MGRYRRPSPDPIPKAHRYATPGFAASLLLGTETVRWITTWTDVSTNISDSEQRIRKLVIWDCHLAVQLRYDVVAEAIDRQRP